MHCHDLIIIGAGPAGLAAAIAAGRADLDYRIFEKGALVNSIFRFPSQMVFFTTPELLEIGGLPFVSPREKPTRDETLRYYRRVVEACGIDVAFSHRVTAVAREPGPADGPFTVETTDGEGRAARWQSRTVLVSTGTYDHPNRLGVPGEDLPHVSHYYTEPHPFYRKQVVVVVELKARFDEHANIEWARILERAGVHVAYGVVGLKTHCKLAMVVRRERGGIAHYCFVGTGNFNADTARIYEDFGLLTADRDFAADVAALFNSLTGYSRKTDYRKLAVAPHSLSQSLVRHIAAEAAEPDGHIFMKMNAIVDNEVIDALYEASQQGCRIDLVVRGICCLVPGVGGLSENISVRSIVGRFLEHSRLYRFGTRDRGYTILLGSADAMPRNLRYRVEALAPVEAPALISELAELTDMYLDDGIARWELGSDGEWTKHCGTDLHESMLTLHADRRR